LKKLFSPIVILLRRARFSEADSGRSRCRTATIQDACGSGSCDESLNTRHHRAGGERGILLLPVLLALIVFIIAALAYLGVGSHDRRASPNVILVVVDTLRADHLGLYGYDRPTSPGLDAWAASGRVYDNAHASSSWTLPSFGSIYSGQLLARHGAGLIATDGSTVSGPRGHHAVDPEVPMVAQIMKDHGYATAAVMNNPFLSPELGVGAGFDTYDYLAGSNQQIRRAREIVSRGLAWIDNHSRGPYLLVLHFIDPHMDYDPPDEVRGRFTGAISSRRSLPVTRIFALRRAISLLSDSDKAFITAAYDEEILGIDAATITLRYELAARGFFDSGLLIYTSDHGEELFEHGSFEHGHAMWEQLLHVPLIVWGKDVKAGREHAPVSHVDLMPTILEAAGLPVPAGIEGRSLLHNLHFGTPIPPRRLYAEGNLYGNQRTAVFDGAYKLVFERAGTSTPQLYDLSVDPTESDDIASAQQKLVDSMVAESVAHLDSAAALRSKRGGVSLAPETREKLRSLGYTE